jgi:hypothetical protein
MTTTTCIQTRTRPNGELAMECGMKIEFANRVTGPTRATDGPKTTLSMAANTNR